jgi:hypothetical protein
VTNLERLIKAHTEATTVTMISAATERLAEEMAREVVKDPAFRAELQRLVRTHFSASMEALATNGKNRRRRRVRKAVRSRLPR